ncbi:MAG: MarR family transcriptional regulator [Burkholderiales bacterium]|jgi:DNA-binding MarR family transcriptional regulator|nr:MarR family transcriptional regulator [Burkholderiales bacterium]
MTKVVIPAGPKPEDALRLDSQVCFPLYAASRMLTRAYQPFLDPLGITYPQYIVMMILWEDAPCTVSHVGQRAMLNTNTLTPLLKRLEQLGFIQRQRRATDERVVEISLTKAGKNLQPKCACIPSEMAQASGLPPEKIVALKQLLEEFLRTLVDTTASES